jgi:hypothetical protein
MEGILKKMLFYLDQPVFEKLKNQGYLFVYCLWKM